MAYLQLVHTFTLVPPGDDYSLRDQFLVCDETVTWRVCYEWEHDMPTKEFYDTLELWEKEAERAGWYKEAERQLFIADAKTAIRQAQAKPRELKAVALTICPENSTPEKCLSIAEIVKGLTCVTSGKYVIEQRSEPGEEPHGWHLHFYINTTYAPSKVKQYAQQKISRRDYVCTYYATVANDKWLTQYMAGQKMNANKDVKVQQDKILRAQLGLQDLYEF